MTAIKKISFYKFAGVPVLIFVACGCITFTTKFKEHPDQFSLLLLADLLITAPLAYYLVIRKKAISKVTVLRVFMAGIFLAGILLSNQNIPALAVIKTWGTPIVELTLIGFVVWKFYKANQRIKALNLPPSDFLTHCRAMLASVVGSEKAANILASEIAVFYYVFSRKDKAIDNTLQFTCYKENGVILVLSTFLFLFMIETAGMHFIFALWSKTAAWILTSLSFYTCLQLFAHIRALRARPIVINDHDLLLRNGLMGGDVSVSISNIEKAELTTTAPTEEAFVNLALLKSFEKPNIALYFNQPVTVVKAFGIRKTAKVVLISIDQPKAFMQALEKARANNVS
jgi:hypothetical protein